MRPRGPLRPQDPRLRSGVVRVPARAGAPGERGDLSATLQAERALAGLLAPPAAALVAVGTPAGVNVADLGFGRTVASEKEAPDMLVHLV